MHSSLWPATWEPSSVQVPSGAWDPAQAQAILIFQGLQSHLQCRSQMASVVFISRQIFRAVSTMSYFLGTLLHVWMTDASGGNLLSNYLRTHDNLYRYIWNLDILLFLQFELSIENLRPDVYQQIFAHTLTSHAIISVFKFPNCRPHWEWRPKSASLENEATAEGPHFCGSGNGNLNFSELLHFLKWLLNRKGRLCCLLLITLAICLSAGVIRFTWNIFLQYSIPLNVKSVVFSICLLGYMLERIRILMTREFPILVAWN